MLCKGGGCQVELRINSSSMKANSLAECLRPFQTKGSRAPITELLIKIDFVLLSIYTLYLWCYRLSVNLFYTGSEYVVPCLFPFMLMVVSTAAQCLLSRPRHHLKRHLRKTRKKYSVLEASKEVSERGIKEASPTLSIQQSLSCSDILSKWGAPKWDTHCSMKVVLK